MRTKPKTSLAKLGLIRSGEVGRRLGVSRQRVHQLVLDGRIPVAVKFDNFHLFDAAEIDRVVATWVRKRGGWPKKKSKDS